LCHSWTTSARLTALVPGRTVRVMRLWSSLTLGLLFSWLTVSSCRLPQR